MSTAAAATNTNTTTASTTTNSHSVNSPTLHLPKEQHPFLVQQQQTSSLLSVLQRPNKVDDKEEEEEEEKQQQQQDYYYDYDRQFEKLQAGAFRSLIQHLQYYSHDVSNIDLMTMAGFCRNCLAKWMVLEARRIVDEDMIAVVTNPTIEKHHHNNNGVTKNDNDDDDDDNDDESRMKLMQLYNSFSYDDAAQYVYGMEYSTWKQLHMKPTTAEQLQKYQASIPLHAVHDTTLLQPRTTIISSSTNNSRTTDTNTNVTTITSTSKDEVAEVVVAPIATTSHTENGTNEGTAAVNTTTTIATATATATTTTTRSPHNDDVAKIIAATDVTDTVSPSTAVIATITHTASATNTSTTTTTTTHINSSIINNNNNNEITQQPKAFHSNVCCVDLDDDDDIQDTVDPYATKRTATTTTTSPSTTSIPNVSNATTEAQASIPIVTTTTNESTPFTSTSSNQYPIQPMVDIPDMKSYRNEQFPVIAIVTISDRAYAGIYPDQSGPMIATTIRNVPGIPSDLQFIMNMIVPDDMAAIQAKIRTICDNGCHIPVDCIITTGGTGFGIRDVTPEATREIVSYELINFISCILSTTCTTTTTTTNKSNSVSPKPTADTHKPIHRASLLSRGIVGVISSSSSSASSSSILESICDHHTLIVNLPGSPTAIQEMLPILLPYILHIIVELQHITPDILHIG